MALLEKIRNKTSLLVTIVVVTLFIFILNDFLRAGSFFYNKKKDIIAIINGKIIHYVDYQSKIEDRINEIQQNNYSLTDDEQQQIKQIVLNEMIDKILFSQKIQKLGLTVTKDEYKNLIIGNAISPVLEQIPNFQNAKTKKFDKASLLQFLQTIESDEYSSLSMEQVQQLKAMKKKWINIEEQILNSQLQKKYSTLVSSLIFTNCLEAKSLYDENEVSVNFDYVAQPYHSISNKKIIISNSEIQKLYSERKKNYKKSEITQIDYIISKIIPSKNDFQLVKTKLNSLKNLLKSSKYSAEVIQNTSNISYINAYKPYDKLNKNEKCFVKTHQIGSVSQPLLTNRTYNLYKLEGIKIDADSIKLNILLIPPLTYKLKFQHLCDSLIQILQKGTPFSNLALKISNGETSGELGWVTESQLISQINRAGTNEILKAKVNKPVIIKSATHTFLVQVIKKTKPVKKYKIANISIKVVPSAATRVKLYNHINLFISSNHSLFALKKNAKKAGFILRTNVSVAKNQINIDKIQNTRHIVQWAFNHKKGTISNIYGCQNSECFIVAAIEKRFKKGFLPLNSVLESLKIELINKKKEEKLISYYKNKTFKTLNQYAKAMNTTPQSVQSMQFGTVYIPTIGEEPILNVKATKAPIHQISGPYYGRKKIYFLYITEKKINQEIYNAEKYKKQIQMYNAYLLSQVFQLSEIIKENAKIENYFNNFF